jgi:xanthine dehydrogenase YagR molybdenum-binding subunit
MTSETYVGKPLSRVDGRLKVTGGATYAADTRIENVAHGVLVVSTVAKGRIQKLDTGAAEKAPGVVRIISHLNAPKLPVREELPDSTDPASGRPLQLFQDNAIYSNGQPIAVVVAESFEQAVYAANLVKVSYKEDKAVTQFSQAAMHPFEPTKSNDSEKSPADYSRGNLEQGYSAAEIKVSQTYELAAEHHNPMEPHATLAVWEGKKLTLHDKTQWVDYVQKQAAKAFGIELKDVRVISPFVGGAFGQALRAWIHVFIAALAAQQVGRPVKLALTRAQMFSIPGYRPCTRQKVSLGATKDGKLTAIEHEGIAQTSTHEEFVESLLDATRMLYGCPNVRTRHRLAAMNVNTPTPMRGPGIATGLWALESAMDELAVALNMDPVELRLKNHADADPEKGILWSSKALKECYQQAADRFGWSRRKSEPRSMRDGHWLIGYGMASATWPTMRKPASVQIRMSEKGSATIRTASHDIGPGTYTVLTQIAADALGLPVGQVQVELGDTRLPTAPVQGGSMTVASVGSAVHDAALALRQKVLALTRTDETSPLHQAKNEQVAVSEGRLFLKDHPEKGTSYREILSRHKGPVEITHDSKPSKDVAKKVSMHAFAAQFVEVQIDEDLGILRLARVTCGIAAGKIINPKTARSQVIGGIVGGIGMGLLEQTVWDPRNARIVNANFADYHIPVNADIPATDAFFIEEQDSHVNPLGAKGIAELALVGMAPAIANAVYHATGKRIRELPITLDNLL